MTVTRVQVIPAQFAAEHAAREAGTLGQDQTSQNLPISRVHVGAISHTIGGEVVQNVRTVHQVSFEGTKGGGVMATRRMQNGQDTIELIPGVPGSRTHTKQGLRDGIIKETSPGVYEDVKAPTGQQMTLETKAAEDQQAAQAEQQEQNRQQAVDNDEIFNAEEDAAFQKDFANVPDHTFRSAAASVVNAVTVGGTLDRAAQTLSRDTGMDPSRAALMVDNAVWTQQLIVDRAIEKVGVGADLREEFYEAARNEPGKLGNALRYLQNGRDVSHFQAMARDWLSKSNRLAQVANDSNESATSGRTSSAPSGSAMAATEEALRAAGMATSVTKQGVLMVRPANQPNARWVKMSDL